MRIPALLSSKRAQDRFDGFTLLEMLVAMAILSIILAIIFTLTQQTAQVYKSTGGQMDSFRSARNAFESLTRNLSLATLNNYYDYVDASGQTRAEVIQRGDSTATTFTPTAYARTSDLHFVSGWYNTGSALYSKQVTHSVFFQAPLGFTSTPTYSNLENMLNACGYYIEYKADDDKPNFISLTNVYRYRLMEFIQPAENLTVYTTTDTSWFTSALTAATPPVHQLATNIIALIILPRSTSGDPSLDPLVKGADAMLNYQYNTRASTSSLIHHQLPPILDVTMVAIDEASAAKLLPNTAVPPVVIENALSGLFQNSTPPPAQPDADLTALGSDLTASHINYHLFRTLVPLRNSKWSSQ